jgi:hypothetical protein
MTFQVTRNPDLSLQQPLQLTLQVVAGLLCYVFSCACVAYVLLVLPLRWIGDVDNMERLQSDYEELFRQYQVGCQQQVQGAQCSTSWQAAAKDHVLMTLTLCSS